MKAWLGPKHLFCVKIKKRNYVLRKDWLGGEGFIFPAKKEPLPPPSRFRGHMVAEEEKTACYDETTLVPSDMQSRLPSTNDLRRL